MTKGTREGSSACGSCGKAMPSVNIALRAQCLKLRLNPKAEPLKELIRQPPTAESGRDTHPTPGRP